jgi:hypothetical protein
LIDFVPLLSFTPLHDLQKLFTILPVPLHAPHVTLIPIMPACTVVTPDPLQRLQVSGLVPGGTPLPPQVLQSISVSNVTVLVHPWTASIKESSTEVWKIYLHLLP